MRAALRDALVADVAFDLLASAGASRTRLFERHASLIRRALASPNGHGSWVTHLRPSLSAIGERFGGAPAAARLPVACLLAMGFEDRPDAMELLRAAYERAEAGWPDDERLWAETAFHFGARAVGRSDGER